MFMAIRPCSVRRMATTAAKKVNLADSIKSYPFVRRFLYDDDDPIKQKWQMISDWSEQCQHTMELTESQFKVLRQRYELTALYEDESLVQSSPFLKDMYDKIADEEDVTNTRTLSDLQFETAKKIMSDVSAAQRFKQSIPDLLSKHKDIIDTLKYRNLNYEQFDKSLHAWATYKFLSYAHPKAVQLRDTMIENNGELDGEQIKDLIHYMKRCNSYKFSNRRFNEAMKWFARMNWVFEHALSEDLYSQQITQYFDMLYTKYDIMQTVLDDPSTLQRCRYTQVVKGEVQEMEPEKKDLELWLAKLSKKEKDPLIVWLKENLASDNTYYGELQDAIVNRFQLDIGGRMDEYQQVLLPLLHNEPLYQFAPDQIEVERQKVLKGKELTKEYMDELTEMIQSLQKEFRAEKMNWQ